MLDVEALFSINISYVQSVVLSTFASFALKLLPPTTSSTVSSLSKLSTIGSPSTYDVALVTAGAAICIPLLAARYASGCAYNDSEYLSNTTELAQSFVGTVPTVSL